jgi:hypothetical protein
MDNATSFGVYDYGVGPEEIDEAFPGCIGINGTADTSILTQSISVNSQSSSVTSKTASGTSTAAGATETSTTTTKQGIFNSITSAIGSHLTATVSPTGTGSSHSGANHVGVFSTGVFGVVLIIGAAVFL